MVDALSAYLRAATAERFDLARCNCMLWVARWVELRTGVNPAESVWTDGGEIDVLETARAAMFSAGFARTMNPGRGDVGVVMAPKPTAAICTGARWAALAPEGLAVSSWRVMASWTVP